MESDSPLFSTQDPTFSALYAVFLVVAVFLAVVVFAMAVVAVKNRIFNSSEVLATVPPPNATDVPPTRLGQATMLRMPSERQPQTQEEQQVMAMNWAQQMPQPARWRPLGEPRRLRRWVTFVIRHAIVEELEITVEIKEWRTVFMLLLVIGHRTSIAVADLTVHGRKLQENHTLRQCGFEHGDYVELTLWPQSAHVSI